MGPILFFLKKLLLCDVSHIELFTRKILNVLVEWICPDEIIPDSGFIWTVWYIYIYIYIYRHPQTDDFVVSQLFSVARHIGHFKLGLTNAQPYVRLCILALSYQLSYASSGIIRHYVVDFVCFTFCLTGYQSAQFLRNVLDYTSGSCKFLRQSVQAPGIYIYIYIYR